MVKAELAFFKVQVDGVSGDALSLGKAMFGEGPEGFDAVDAAVTADELVIAIVDPEVLGVADINQALVPTLAIAVDDAFSGTHPRITFCNTALRASGQSRCRPSRYV